MGCRYRKGGEGVVVTWPVRGDCCGRLRYWVFRRSTLVAPFADEVEAALEERVVVRRRGSGQGEDGRGEGRGGFAGLCLGSGLGGSGGTEVRMRWLGSESCQE